MFSRFFIERPIFATVISIIITLVGAVSIANLPIAQLPDLVPPMVTVSASYRGANPEVLATTVAAPIEREVNGVDNMIYMNSTSASTGDYTLNVSFQLGTDPDQAVINVNNRLQAAMASLPDEVKREGVTVEKKSSSILLLVSLFSPDERYDTIFLSNYALINVIEELQRIKGVGSVTNFAAQDYAMRIWLQPDRLLRYQMTPNDVINAIKEQNQQFGAGRLGDEPMEITVDKVYTLNVRGRLSTVPEFEEIILRSDATGASVRLKDVARVELGAQTYNFIGNLNQTPCIPIGIFLAPGANALATADAIKAKMVELKKSFPEGVDYAIAFDTTPFISASVKEVVTTLFEAIGLVVLVVFLFLQNWRATLIPCLAVPVSIIGTFAGMYAFGFSINTLTLFGMVLAIGIVVDDAIVVIENVERIMSSEGLSAKDASIKAMEEVSGPVVAIVLVLCSVFIPVAFLGGLVGVIFQQFAITIAVSVVLSGLVALTLTPALCALMLKPTHKTNFVFDWFNRLFAKITNGYLGGVHFLLKRGLIALVLYAFICFSTVSLFKSLPSSLAPTEDQGYIFSVFILPDATSLQRTAEAMVKMDEFLIKNPLTEYSSSFAGYDLLSGSLKTFMGTIFIDLKLWDERKGPGKSSTDLINQIMAFGLQHIPQGVVVAFNPPPITGLSSTGGFEAYIQSRNGDLTALSDITAAIVAEAAKNPDLQGVSTTFHPTTPQKQVNLDRAKAKSLDLPVNAVFEAMGATIGATYVNDFTYLSRSFKVLVQADSEFRSNEENIRDINVRSNSGAMVPLASVVELEPVTGPDMIERFNLFTAAKVQGNPSAGHSSGQAIQAMEETVAKVLAEKDPTHNFSLSWIGSAYQEKQVGAAAAKAFAMGIIMVFLILAAQYERWSLPIAVLLAVPFGAFGAGLAVLLAGLTVDVYVQVSLLTLVALAAKNAILIVEFAIMKYDEGLPLFEAASEAAHLRFRPIIMTSLAFILGCTPLLLSSGAGAASRHSVGTGVIGGMLAATCIGPFFIPFFFKAVMSFSEFKFFKKKDATTK